MKRFGLCLIALAVGACAMALGDPTNAKVPLFTEPLPVKFELGIKPQAQEPPPFTDWAFAIARSITNKRTATGTATDFGRLTNVFWRGNTIDVKAFLGITIDGTESPMAGALAGKSGKLGDQGRWFVGIGPEISNAKPVGLMIGGSLSIRFSTSGNASAPPTQQVISKIESPLRL